MNSEAGESLPVVGQTTLLQKPTSVRYKVLAFLGAMTFILYLDRVCLGQAKEDIRRQLELTNFDMGLIDGAFLIAYGLFEVPTGRLADRYGSRGVLTRIVLAWSVFTALTATAFSFWVLAPLRFLFGAGEAGALPNAARVLRQWFPETVRGRAQGVVTTCMLIGGAVSFPATGALIELVGWRWSFVLFGSLGLFWSAAFFWWFRDSPQTHPSVNEAERQLIAAGRPAGEHTSAAHAPIPWKLVLRSPNVWLMGGLINCGAAVFYMVIFWYPTYLKKGRGLEGEELLSGFLASLVIGGGAVGCILGGFLTEQLMHRTGNLRWSRCVLGATAFLLGGLSLLAGLLCEWLLLTVFFHALAHMCVQIQIPAWWATTTKISGQHVGALFGLMNSLGVIGAFAFPLLLARIVDSLKEAGYTGRDQWDPGLYMFGFLMLVGAVLWLLVNPSKSLVEPVTPAADEPNQSVAPVPATPGTPTGS